MKMACPQCHKPPGKKLKVDENRVSCPHCGALMFELPAPGLDWLDRYLEQTSSAAMLALVQAWFPGGNRQAAMTFIGWLGSQLREQYAHGSD